MKVVVVSDTHNNWPNFKKAIEWANKEDVKLILHCGDISSQEIVDQAKAAFAKASAGQVKFVRGNADIATLPDLPEKTELEIEDPPSPGASARRRKIAFSHFPDIAKKLAQSGKFDVVFYGHTHRPWDEKVPAFAKASAGKSETHMINPGELAGQFNKPTFAVYDTVTGNLELKILERL